MQDDDPDAAFVAGADATPVVSNDPPAAEPEAKEPAEPAEASESEQQAEGTEDKAAEAEPDKPKQTPWFQKRIDEVTRARYEAERRAEALEQQLRQLRAPQDGQQPQDAPDPVAVAKEQLRQEMAAEAFNKSCNDIHGAGVNEFPDFDQALGTFKLLGGLPPTLVEAAIEAGDAHKVLYSLGKNPEEAARILQLPPARMGAALAKVAASKPAAAAKPVSNAPAPIKPIGGQGKVTTNPEDMPIDQWMAWHDKQQAAKVAR